MQPKSDMPQYSVQKRTWGFKSYIKRYGFQIHFVFTVFEMFSNIILDRMEYIGIHEGRYS